MDGWLQLLNVGISVCFTNIGFEVISSFIFVKKFSVVLWN